MACTVKLLIGWVSCSIGDEGVEGWGVTITYVHTAAI